MQCQVMPYIPIPAYDLPVRLLLSHAMPCSAIINDAFYAILCYALLHILCMANHVRLCYVMLYHAIQHTPVLRHKTTLWYPLYNVVSL